MPVMLIARATIFIVLVVLVVAWMVSPDFVGDSPASELETRKRGLWRR